MTGTVVRQRKPIARGVPLILCLATAFCSAHDDFDELSNLTKVLSGGQTLEENQYGGPVAGLPFFPPQTVILPEGLGAASKGIQWSTAPLTF
jgi:hypothetical protein